MILLSIETTGPISSVALYRDGIVTEIRNEDQYSHLKQLMPMVNYLLKEEKTDPIQIDAIAVSQGPGSFTGIRIGMVSAKGLAQVWNKPIVEVPTLASFAFRDYSWEDGKRLLYCPVLDAKMHQVYAAAYEKNNRAPIVRGGAYDMRDFLDALRGAAEDYDAVVFFGDGSRVYKELIEECGFCYAFAPKEDDCQTALGTAMLGAELYKEGLFKSCFDAQPEYFRLPEAERKFKTKSLDIRPANSSDTERLCELEKASFPLDAWSDRLIRDAVEESERENAPLHFRVAADDRACAYILFTFLPDRPDVPGEIQSIATVPDRRRQGIARRLMLDALKLAKEGGCRLMQLEVRQGNIAAICLYESLGFKKTGVRAAYYQDGESAVLMDKNL